MITGDIHRSQIIVQFYALKLNNCKPYHEFTNYRMSLDQKEETLFKNLGDCSGWMENRDSMQNKLLYLILKEMQESRKEARRTNDLLYDIRESLVTTQRKVERLAKAVETRDGDFYHLRTKEIK
jgi:hypothetical protein